MSAELNFLGEKLTKHLQLASLNGSRIKFRLTVKHKMGSQYAHQYLLPGITLCSMLYSLLKWEYGLTLLFDFEIWNGCMNMYTKCYLGSSAFMRMIMLLLNK